VSAITFFLHHERYQLLLSLRPPSSSFGLAITVYFFIGFTVALFRAVVSSISPHPRTPLDNIIFYLAPPAILSSILSHGCTPLAIPFSIQPYGHAILEKYFSIWPHGCAYPGNILLLITHQGFLRAAFLQATLAPIPTWFFKASVHRLWCCLSCNAM
jgi:hypothetical protein